MANHKTILCLADIPQAQRFADAAAAMGARVLRLGQRRWRLPDAADWVELDDWSDAALVHRTVLQAVAQRAWGPITAVANFSERYVELAATLRGLLQIPTGVQADAAPYLRDKLLMRRRAVAHGIRCPAFFDGESQDALREFLEAHRRVIIKPRRGWACAEVAVCDSWGDVARQLQSRPPASTVMEQFIDAPMLHIGGVIGDRVPLQQVLVSYAKPLLAATRAPGDCIMVHTPAQDSPLASRARDLLRQVVHAFELEFCMVELEFFATPDGPVLCEVAARPASSGVPTLYTQITSQDPFHVFAAALCTIQEREATWNGSYAALALLNSGPGRLAWVNPKVATRDQPGVIVEQVGWPGDVYMKNSINNTVFRLFVHSDEEAECLRRLQRNAADVQQQWEIA